MKYLTVLLLALALAACDLGASSPSAVPLPSIDHSMGAGSTEPDASADCANAFADLDLTDLADLTDLDAASDVLDETIASCGSVADWQEQLSTALPMVSLDGAEEFLAARCAANSELADSTICEEAG